MSVLILFVILTLYFIYKKNKGNVSYPPGPTSLPIVGNLLSVWLSLKKYKLHHVVWKKWCEKYGNILGLRLGVLNIVVVTGKDLIKEVSTREVFDGRPDGLFFVMRSFNKKIGIVFSEGQIWSKSRNTAMKCLRNFGFGSRSMETDIIDECTTLVDYLLEKAGKPVVANTIFNITIINILWKLVAGVRYDIGDEKLNMLCNNITRTFKAANMSGGVLSSLPFLRHFIPNLLGYTELKASHEQLHAFLKETIDEHKSSFDPKNPRDLIDTFLIDMMKNNRNNFTLEELDVICLDLLEAGVETVNNTAVFLLLYLLQNENVQKRVQHEIDGRIGFIRKPNLNDRARLVYTEAVLLEALRISTVATMGIAHKAVEDAKLGDYFIPKGTYILLSLHDLHNGEHWTDPTTFRPERFLNANKKIYNDELLIPFGIGKRRCIGEGLARSELFLFLTHLLQRFDLKLPEGDPLPSTEPIDGITLSAKEFRIVFKPRF